MFRTAFAAAAVLVAALTMVVGSAHAQPRRIEVGTLTCAMSSSIGLIVGSQKNVNCVFRGQPGEPEEAYTGTMTTVGLDIGITTGGVIVWTYSPIPTALSACSPVNMSERPEKFP